MRRPIVFLVALGLLGACSGASGNGTADGAPSAGSSPVAGRFSRPGAFAGEPCGLEATAADVWILTCSGTLLQVPKAGGAGRAQTIGGEVLALDGLRRGSEDSLLALVWIRTRPATGGKVVPIAPADGTLGAPLDVGSSPPMSAAQTGDTLWVGMTDGRLVAIRDGTLREASRSAALMWVVADGDTLWTIDENGDAAQRDASDGDVRATATGAVPEPIAAAAAFGALWAANPARLVRIADGTTTPRAVGVSGTVNAIEPCGGAVWLSQPDFGLRSVAPDGTVTASVRLGVAPRYLACDGSLLWVLAEDGRLGSIRTTP
ncbi:MAG: hypothetical protein ACRDKS_03260 [Actinomycetota bacterium]